MSEVHVLVKYDNGWAVGFTQGPPDRAGRVQVELDLVDTPVESFRSEDLYPLQSYSKVHSWYVHNDTSAVTLLKKHGYTADTVPPELQATFREMQVFDDFERLFTKTEFRQQMKYDAKSNSVSFSGTDDVGIKLPANALLPCRISSIAKATTVTLMLAGGSVNPNLPSQLPENIRGTFTLSSDGYGVPEHFDMSKWFIFSANILIISLPKQRFINPRMRPGVTIPCILTRLPVVDSMKCFPKGNYTVGKLLLLEASNTRPFSFDGMQAGIGTLELPDDSLPNVMSLLTAKHWPDVITGCKYADELFIAMNKIRKAPKHLRNPTIRSELARLYGLFPREAMSKRT